MERIVLMPGHWSESHLQSTCQVPDITTRWKLIQIPEQRALVQMQVPVSRLVGVQVKGTRDTHACEWHEIAICSLCLRDWFCMLVDTWPKLMCRAICISVLGALGPMVNPKDLGVIPRTPCAHNILFLFPPSHVVSWLSFTLECHCLPKYNLGLIFSFETCMRKSFIIHYLSPGRKLPLDVVWWTMPAWFCLSSFNWIIGWTIFWDERHIMATADLLPPIVLQVCYISQVCSGLTGSQGSKQPCNYCIQFQTSICYCPNRAGPSVSVCYRKGSVLSVCNRFLRGTNWVKLTLRLPRNIQGRWAGGFSPWVQWADTVCLALFELWPFFFVVGLAVNKFANVAFGSPLQGLHSMPTTPKCKEHFCTLCLTSCQVGTNYLWGSVLHPDFVTEEKCQLSSFFPLALPTWFEADELCASAEIKDHKWLSMGSCILSSSFKKPGINGSYQCKGKSSLLAEVCRLHIAHQRGFRCDQVITP